MDVSDCKAFDEQRNWILFQPFHPEAAAPVHEERVIAILLRFGMDWRIYLFYELPDRNIITSLLNVSIALKYCFSQVTPLSCCQAT